MAFKRTWKTHDLCDLFESIKLGRIPMAIRSNFDLCDKYEWYSIQLDPFWPFGITDNETCVEDKTMKFEIENDIKLKNVQTKPTSEKTKAIDEALSVLESGQSFLVPLEGDEYPAKITVLVSAYKKKFPSEKTFTSRTLKNNEGKQTGVRIWRLD